MIFEQSKDVLSRAAPARWLNPRSVCEWVKAVTFTITYYRCALELAVVPTRRDLSCDFCCVSSGTCRQLQFYVWLVRKLRSSSDGTKHHSIKFWCFSLNNRSVSPRREKTLKLFDEHFILDPFIYLFMFLSLKIWSSRAELLTCSFSFNYTHLSCNGGSSCFCELSSLLFLCLFMYHRRLPAPNKCF